VAQVGDKVRSRPKNGGQESLPPRKTGDTGVAAPAENHYMVRGLRIGWDGSGEAPGPHERIVGA
jgi:hypothetical protein